MGTVPRESEVRWEVGTVPREVGVDTEGTVPARPTAPVSWALGTVPGVLGTVPAIKIW